MDGQPTPISLDGRRIVARLASQVDPDTGSYTLKRWKVWKLASAGEIVEVTLRPYNTKAQPLTFTPANGDVQVVAEYLETIG